MNGLVILKICSIKKKKVKKKNLLQVLVVSLKFHKEVYTHVVKFTYFVFHVSRNSNTKNSLSVLCLTYTKIESSWYLCWKTRNTRNSKTHYHCQMPLSLETFSKIYLVFYNIYIIFHSSFKNYTTHMLFNIYDNTNLLSGLYLICLFCS